MAYTTINKSTDYFNTKLYTGNGSTNAITGVGFEPSLTWIKNRSNTSSHNVFDAVRGATKAIFTNATDAEYTEASRLSAFNSDGFTINGDTSNQTNANNDNFVSWNWKANGAGSANTDGSISSTVSANTTSGFSIVSFTATGSASTIGHGLGVVPKVVLVKSRTAVLNWFMYNSNFAGANDFITLNETGAVQANSVVFNGTAPTSSVFSVGTVHGNGSDVIAYCFAEKTGYSKFGSYVGNGNADGTFVYTGFKPAFVMVKRSSGADNWMITDNKRSSSGGNNVIDRRILPNLSNAEFTNTSPMDLLSNGFKHRDGDDINNASGSTYIYMAFAEAPLVGSNNVPCTAR